MEEKVSKGVQRPMIERLNLELLNKESKQQILNIIDNNDYNFPKENSKTIPSSIAVESTVLLPRPLNLFTNHSRQLNPKKSNDTSFMVESPLKDPKYFSNHRF
jgi:hypothetical protein